MRIVGIGTDIAECARIERMVERHGELFLDRVYTPDELAYCQERKTATQHYAGRWAAKEAVLKAIGTGWVRGIGWRDVEVVREGGGKPSIRLHGGAKQAAEQRGIQQVLITISHCDCHAIAYAVAVAEE